jgi:hypothetical protein
MRYFSQCSFLLIFTILLIYSCEKSTEPDPEPENEEVVNLLTDGMWEIVDSTGVVDTALERRGRFKYNRDHTGDVYMLWEWSEGEWGYFMSITWRLKDNSTILVISYESNSDSYRIEKLTDTELILYMIEQDTRQFYIKVQD